MEGPAAPDRRLRFGELLAVAGVAPFLAGRLLPSGGGRRLVPCAVKLVFGLPCPTCGATRAFALAARGDLRYRSYNSVWVDAALACVAVGVLGLAGGGPERLRGPVPSGTALLALAAPVFAAGWVRALRRGL